MSVTIKKLICRTNDLGAMRYMGLRTILPMVSMESDASDGGPVLRHPGKISGPVIDRDDFFRGRDRYLWMQTQVEIPVEAEDATPVGIFDLGETGEGSNSGFESLLYINGEPFQGVDTFHNEVNLELFAGKTVELTFLLWTGLDGGTRRTFFHQIRQADIGFLHRPTDELYHLSRAICDTVLFLPNDSVERQQLIDMLDAAFMLINWDRDKFYITVDNALKLLDERLSIAQKKSGITVYCVGHTHIDVAWLWRLKHTREKALRSFSTALRLMEQNDDFIFLQTQPQLYKYIKQDCPKLYEKIKLRIAEGRWEVDGGMWLEADCNISSGESLVRQLLHGCNFIKEEFGRDCTHLWLPDVFGYSWALPQLLKQCRIKTFMTTKISWNQTNRMPHDLFYWRGIDGTEILTYFITTPHRGMPPESFRTTYNAKLTTEEVFGCWRNFKDKDITRSVLMCYGHGDGGGGVTSEMLKTRRALDRLPGAPNVKVTSASAFFDNIHNDAENAANRIPVWDGDLYLEGHRGTYTTQAKNKKLNRRLEYKLAQTEWLASYVFLAGKHYPAKDIREGWEILLRNQFHDIVPGSSIREVYEDSWKEYEKANRLLDNVNESSLDIFTEACENSWLLYNFGSFRRHDCIFVPENRKGKFLDEHNQALDFQPCDGGYLVRVDMEPLSMKNIYFAVGDKIPDAAGFAGVDLEARKIITPFYNIKWDIEGRLTSIFDAENEREVLKGFGNLLEVYEDKPLDFDAWDVDCFYAEKREVFWLSAKPSLVENGRLRAMIRFEYSYGKSKLIQDVTVYRDIRRIDFVTHVDWYESHRMLKAAFEVDIRSTKATYDIQFGYVERPAHKNTSWDQARFEAVGHKWADLSDSGYGVSLLNDCKYGYSIQDSRMSVSLLRSPKFPDPEADMGEHSFTYSLLPHFGTIPDCDTIAESVALNLTAGVVRGRRINNPKRLFYADNPNIMIDAIKKAENENGLILRLHEIAGGVQKTTVKSDFPIGQFAKCDLLERAEQKTAGNEIPCKLGPFEIQTFIVYFGGRL